MSATIERPVESPPPAVPKAGLMCRRMVEADVEGAIALLNVGFPERGSTYWRRGLLRLRDRPPPEGLPPYGYVLIDGDRLVGIILLLFATSDTGMIRGNVSSWYVEPAYRGFSHLLLAAPLKLKDVTLFNISPAPPTIETIKAQGFREYVAGTFCAFAALSPPVFGARVRRVTAGAPSRLADLAAIGCLCFEVTHEGSRLPFAFRSGLSLGRTIACAQLVYCRDVADFARFAGPLGRRLLTHGLPVVLVDANEALAGVPGWYRAGRSRKFYRGAEPPRLGDLGSSEFVVFGP